MTLPKICHELIDTNLSIDEKIKYMKARCVISACLHAESGSIIYEREAQAISTLNSLNNKIKEGIKEGII